MCIICMYMYIHTYSTYCAFFSLDERCVYRCGIMKDECGGVSNSSIFCSELAFLLFSGAFSVLHCALCIIRTYVRFLFIYWFRSQRPKECLYLVTFIVPEFPQTFSSGFFFLFCFLLHSFIIQKTTIATSFSIPPLSSNSKKITLRPVSTYCSFFSHSFQMLVIALLHFSCKGRN